MNKAMESYNLLDLNEDKLELGEFRIKLVTDLFIRNDDDLSKNNMDFSDDNFSESDID